MQVLDLIHKGDGAQGLVSSDEVLVRYRSVRAAGEVLNAKLVNRLSVDTIQDASWKLGFVRGDELYFDNEDQTAVLMDYCIYDVWQKGRNAIGQYIKGVKPESELERICLQAMSGAIYSVFCVESVEPGFGLIARDLLNNGLVPIVDVGLSSTAKPGLIFTSRLLQIDGFSITSGAGLPLGILAAEVRDAWVSQLSKINLKEASGRFDPAALIRAILAQNGLPEIRYVKT